MAYHIRRKDPTMTDALRRMAADRLDTALEATEAQGVEERFEAVHDIRKRIKELRGLIRLVRPDFPGYDAANAALRDTGRKLSPLRDAKVRLDTLDQLVRDFSVQDDLLADYRAELRAARDRAYSDAEAGPLLAGVRVDLRELREASGDWTLGHKGAKAIFPGLGKTYGAARKAMEKARRSRDTEDFHTWRKHVKYHWYHGKILRPVWPEAIKAHDRLADRLGELLGAHHDLAVLAQEARAAGLSGDSLAGLEASLAARARDQERTAFHMGGRLLADTPEALAARWSAWWTHWLTE
ncbi:CHAD domain-containing protein [Celeribacter indicus]|uniref:CHAD domain-containing protein n=1 Tax=Celeribacter indicus TaxID=1208324 RepID=A0A0B5DZ66_9RHOB|nr:CHAD domain-containing protein [Celeribacter indicus]AJE48289.1 CHAD domain-containing protein [Celeribacter indicus]SDW71817.1 CHAD domain-containing protein [Celeribacter indicus]